MELLTQHWSLDPVVIVAALLAAVHHRGLRRRLQAMRTAGRPTEVWKWRAATFYVGLLALVIAVASPLDYFSESYLTAHILQHILLAFGAPPLIVLGAPWAALQRGLPQQARTTLASVIQRSHRNRLWSRTTRLLAGPVFAIAAFNAYMIFWHIPGPFDFAQHHVFVHLAVEHAGLVALGVFLWRHLLATPAFAPRLTPLQRVAGLFVTNAVMVMIAMTLVLFSHELYPFYAGMAHPALSQYSDQQIAGSALWVCGEFSLAPAIYWNIQMFMRAQAKLSAVSVDAPSVGTQTVGAAPLAPWARSANRWAPVSPETAEIGWHRARLAQAAADLAPPG